MGDMGNMGDMGDMGNMGNMGYAQMQQPMGGAMMMQQSPQEQPQYQQGPWAQGMGAQYQQNAFPP